MTCLSLSVFANSILNIELLIEIWVLSRADTINPRLNIRLLGAFSSYSVKSFE